MHGPRNNENTKKRKSIIGTAWEYFDFLNPSKFFSWNKKEYSSEESPKDKHRKKKRIGEKVVGGTVYFQQLGSKNKLQPCEPAKIIAIEHLFGSKKFTLKLVDGREEKCSEDNLLLHPLPWVPSMGDNCQSDLDELLRSLQTSPGEVKNWGQMVGLISSRRALLPPEAAPLLIAQLCQSKSDSKIRSLVLKLMSFVAIRDPAGTIGFLPAFTRNGGDAILASWAADPEEYDGALINYLSSLLQLPMLNQTSRNLVEQLRSTVFVANQDIILQTIVKITKPTLQAPQKPDGKHKAALDFWRSTIKQTDESIANTIIKSEFLDVLLGDLLAICQEGYEPAWKKSYLLDLLKVWLSVGLTNSFVQMTIFEAICSQSGLVDTLLEVASKGDRSKLHHIAALVLLGLESCSGEEIKDAVSEVLGNAKSIVEHLKEEYPRLAKNRTDLLKTHVSKRGKSDDLVATSAIKKS